MPRTPDRALSLLLYTVDVTDLRSNLNQERVSVLLPLIRPLSERTRWPLYRLKLLEKLLSMHKYLG